MRGASDPPCPPAPSRSEGIGRVRTPLTVAELVPSTGAPDVTVDEAIVGLRSFRARHPLGAGLTIRDLITEGRR